MKLSAAALAGVAVLVFAIVAIASSSASGTPNGTVLAAGSAPGWSARAGGSPAAACRPQHARGSSRLLLSGACGGELAGAFTCDERDETLYLSTRAGLKAGSDLYLSVVVPDYAGPGTYEGAVFAEVTGRPLVARWSNRSLALRVEASGAVSVKRAGLAAEPGTPARGRIAIAGSASCTADVGLRLR